MIFLCVIKMMALVYDLLIEGEYDEWWFIRLQLLKNR
jgi:hypothetical protein